MADFGMEALKYFSYIFLFRSNTKKAS